MEKSSNLNADLGADFTALRQAAEWFAVLRDETATKSDHMQWQVWLNAHPQHQSAWAEVQAVQSPFLKVVNIGDKQATKVALAPQSKISRRHALKLLSFGGTALFAGFLVKQYSPWRDWVTAIVASDETFRMAVGKTGMTTLAEGSKLWLNTGSQVDVAYSFALRRITLRAGEILIESAKDNTSPARPLVVDTIHGRLTALGTRFTVKVLPETTFVAVYEGAVMVVPAQTNQKQVIQAGQQVLFSNKQIAPVELANKARETWTRGILLADSRRLDDFIAELATYRDGKLTVAPEIAHLRLMGAYPLKNTNQVLASIVEALPVRIHQKSLIELALVKR